MPNTQISSYKKESYSAKVRSGKEITHDVYTHGTGKKVVIIIQELPGIGQATLALADKFVNKEYTVVLPHLFGPIGKIEPLKNFVRVMCMRKEFKIFAANKSSPVVDYLAELCKHVKEKYQVKGVAVIGMCLTGNFAISLMASEAVLAGFASQPSLPLFNQNGLHMSESDVTTIKERLDKIGPVHCGRFVGDSLCKKARFDLFNEKFNTDNKERIVFHELPGNHHAILTLDFAKGGNATQKALDDVMDYFDNQLN